MNDDQELITWIKFNEIFLCEPLMFYLKPIKSERGKT